MSPIEEVTFYRAVCDACGLNITDDSGEFAAWSDIDGAANDVDNSDGLRVDGVILCNDCLGRYQGTFPEDEWDERYDELHDSKPDELARLATWIAEVKTDA